MANVDKLRKLNEGDPGHVEQHNQIRTTLYDHEAQLRTLEARVSFLEQPYECGRPHSEHDPTLPAPQMPELPDQPPGRPEPEFPAQTPREGDQP